MPIKKDAKIYFDAGFGVHWTKDNSKAPVESAWEQPGRAEWEYLSKTYRPGYGVGVRLGESSRLDGGGYLANIDVDIKSSDPRHHAEALAKFDQCFPGIRKTAPFVKSGHGLRFLVALKMPVASFVIETSKELTVVLMPTAKINKHQISYIQKGIITQKQLDKGFRVRAAWEIEFMSLSKQGLLPPSIHPDTKKPYEWGRGETAETAIKKIPMISESILKNLPAQKSKQSSSDSEIKSNFNFVDVDLVGSSLSNEMVDAIISGKGVEDRSAYCLSACMAMLRCGFSHDEIISVLTDKSNVLGETAFDHRNTKNRSNAAKWIRDYCLKKAIDETSAAKAFEHEVGVTPLLKTPEERAKQTAQLTNHHWADDLDRKPPTKIQIEFHNSLGTLVPTLNNAVLVLENAVAKNIFRFDEYTVEEIYGIDPPWNKHKKAGSALEDQDLSAIAHWFSSHPKYKMDFKPRVIDDAINKIANDNRFHKMREKLRALPAWDFIPRLAIFLSKYFETKENEKYTGEIFTNWLVASAGRILYPGFKYDSMPVFQGPPKRGKTSIAKLLFFGDENVITNMPKKIDDEARRKIQGSWCIVFDELDKYTKNEIGEMKSFVSETSDKIRMPYGRRWRISPRQCIFMATTNAEKYLYDPTGNRRYHPVIVTKYLKRDEIAGHENEILAIRDQLWAEAIFILDNFIMTGVDNLELTDEASLIAEELQHSKMVENDSDQMAYELKEFIKREQAHTDTNKHHATKAFNFDSFRLSALWGGGVFMKWPEGDRHYKLGAQALRKLGADSKTIKGFTHWHIPPKVLEKYRKEDEDVHPHPNVHPT